MPLLSVLTATTSQLFMFLSFNKSASIKVEALKPFFASKTVVASIVT
ncbi:MAG: hypothetical protein RR128_06610 [Clostridium sp.]